MRTTISLVVSLISSAAAAYTGTVCPDGKMFAQEIAGCYCETDNAQCVNTAVTCGSSRFKDTAKNKDKPSDPKIACCSSKAKCSTITCADGDKQKTNAADLMCALGTCVDTDKTTCCENDATKCKYSTVTCGTTKFKDSAKDKVTAGDYGIKKCCSDKMKCSSYSCPTAGKKQKCNAGTLFCADVSCKVDKDKGIDDEATCCMDDEQKCRGAAVSCGATKFKDSAKYGKVGTNVATCCSDRSKCSTHTCGAGKKRKTNADKLYCAKKPCATTDDGYCCEADATKCGGAAITCGDNEIIDPAKKGVDGTTATACCAKQHTCDKVTCDSGMKHISGASTTYCASTACTTQCEVTKNGKKTTCTTWSCMASTGCTHEKGNTCCQDDTAKCKGATVACGASKYKDSAKWDKGTPTVTQCCTDRAKCSTLTCDAGKKWKKDYKTMYCAEKTCATVAGAAKTADQNTCCEIDTTKCLSIACGSGKIWTSTAKGKVHDGRIATCCTDRALCTSLTCLAGYKQKTGNNLRYCVGASCKQKKKAPLVGNHADHALCCETDTTKCFGASVTCGNNRYKDTNKNGIKGDTDALCCSARAKCSSVTCVAGKKQITAHATTYCTKGVCTDTERDTLCCVNNVKQCGGNVVACDTGRYRDTTKYGTVGTTEALCCTNAAKCSSITCEAGTKKKLLHATTYCATLLCNNTATSADQSTCCEIDDTKCRGVTVSCPACKYKNPGSNGVAAGKYNCCTDKALCTTLTCGTGLKKKTAHATTYCASSVCTSKDYPVCCENVAGKCKGAAVTCAAGKFKDPAKYGVTGATAALCCSNNAKCSAVTCPTGQKQIAGAATTYCAGSSCVTSDNCCENDSTRCQWSGVSCGVGKYKDVSKYGAVGSTAAQCCGTAPLCTTLTCPSALKQISANTTTYCNGALCGSAADVATCCEANPALTACSAALMAPRGELFTKMISGLKCGPAAFRDPLRKDNVVLEHNKTIKCCSNKAFCSSITCGAGQKQITAAATTYCAAAPCVAADAATCCETDNAKCLGASVSCATGKYKDAAKNNAVGTTAALCCTNKVKCTTIACPAGQKQVTNHASLYCTKSSCLIADRATCCINDPTKCRGSCVQCATGTYKDPAKYGAAPGANAQTACCTDLQKCSQLTLLAGQKHKAGSDITLTPALPQLYCSTKKCAALDRSTCVENDARKCLGTTVTCGTKMYKDSASNGVLKGCDAVVSCCSNKARCSTYTCPWGKTLKDNAYNTLCATKTCGTADTSTCCDSDSTVCAGATVGCPTGQYKDSSKGSEEVTDVKTKCCTSHTKCLPARLTVNSTGTVAGAPRTAMTSVIALALAAVVMTVAVAH